MSKGYPQEPDSAVFRALQSLGDSNHSREGMVDLDKLWNASGRRRGRSPRQWAARCNRSGDDIEIVAGYQGESLASHHHALDYAQYLDPAVERFCMELLAHKLREASGRSMLQCPNNPFMALAATAAVMSGSRVSPEEAQRRIIKDAVAESGDLDVYDQETKIAEVQRALGSIKFVDISQAKG
ncbi:hypothetical protein [Singulisphaera sp. PoT]|uniref:hypothetical protein n=1 Tax=Singulisphaera sp. PoT TaxID=3411797 RepID=UPI003BF5D86C